MFSDMGVERFPYIALSYVCGKGAAANTIWLGSEQRAVTPNLFEALQSLRDPFVPMLLWVDALCIDQGNAEEVSSQVAIMDTIFSGAGAVLAFINGQQNDAYLTQTALTVLLKLEFLINEALYIVGQPSSKQPLWEEWSRGLTSGYGPLEALDDLFQSPYFSRFWTIQEVSLNRNTIVCHGGAAIYFRTLLFKAAQDGRWAIPQPMNNHDSNVADAHIENFLSLYHSMLRGRPPTVLQGLLLARDRCATLEHDSIYGILGLLNRGQEEATGRSASAWQTPDYGKDYYDVCLDVCKQVLQDSNNLDVLSATEVRRHHEEDPASTAPGGRAWPSWLPDWTINPVHRGWARSILSTADPVSTSTIYDACRGTEAWYRISQTEDDQHVLHLRGTVIDTVEDTYNHDWDGYDVVGWINWLGPETKVDLPQFLHRPVLLHRYESAGDLELALYQMQNFGHEGYERLSAETPLRDVQKALVNSHSTHFYPSRWVITAEAYLARGPSGVQNGDKIVIFQGAKVPFVIRPAADDGSHFTLVGECYLHQAMYGEMFGDTPLHELDEFALV